MIADTSELQSFSRVVFAADCSVDGDCPHCGIDYAECLCIGPTEDDCEYVFIDGVMYGRRKSLDG